MHPIGEGCEPYSMDFGDREYRSWLERYLTPVELAEYDRRFEFSRQFITPWGDDSPLGRALYELRYWSRRPLTKFLAWRVGQISRLAEQRGGPPPGAAWKIPERVKVPD